MCYGYPHSGGPYSEHTTLPLCYLLPCLFVLCLLLCCLGCVLDNTRDIPNMSHLLKTFQTSLQTRFFLWTSRSCLICCVLDNTRDITNMSHLLKTFQTSFQTENFYGHLNHVSFVENISKPVFKLKILQTNLSKLVEGRGVEDGWMGKGEVCHLAYNSQVIGGDR